MATWEECNKPIEKIVPPKSVLEITENGEYSVFGYSSVDVDVEGGGSGGDFTTATVTVINNNENNFPLDIVIVDDEGGMMFGFTVNSGGTRSATVVLYKDFETYGSYDPNGFVDATFTCTGGVSVDDEYGDVYVTGDGTITISE